MAAINRKISFAIIKLNGLKIIDFLNYDLMVKNFKNEKILSDDNCFLRARRFIL